MAENSHSIDAVVWPRTLNIDQRQLETCIECQRPFQHPQPVFRWQSRITLFVRRVSRRDEKEFIQSQRLDSTIREDKVRDVRRVKRAA